jgi:hypothetical protein
VLGVVAIVILARVSFVFLRRKSHGNSDLPLSIHNTDHVEHTEMDASDQVSPPQYHSSTIGARLRAKAEHGSVGH